jgi:carboxyl-terminal processing protease
VITVKNKIILKRFIHTVFLISLGIMLTNVYLAKNYVMIERATAEKVNKDTPSLSEDVEIEDKYVLIDKTQIGEFSLLFEAYNELRKRYIEEVDTKQLIDGAIGGMAQGLKDSYTFFTPISKDGGPIENGLESSYKGIGAEITILDGYAVITNPFKNSPAYNVGIKPYDRILKVDGEVVFGESLTTVVSKIKGEQGTEVVLEIGRGAMEPFEVIITRDVIDVETVSAEVVGVNDKKIGVISVFSFGDGTAEDFKKSLKRLEDENIEGLVIDVRDNGGGYLVAVQEIVAEFLPFGQKILSMEDRAGNNKIIRSKGLTKNKKAYPIAVLMNSNSASSSEVLAAALKDKGGYTLIGEKTFGKGTVQELVGLADGSEMRITVAKWLTPNGEWIHEKGIEPHIAVEQPKVLAIPNLTVGKDKVEIGTISDGLENVQEVLSSMGYDLPNQQGYFDQETSEALRDVQTMNGLPPTGDFDKETALLLNQKLLEIRENIEFDNQLNEALDFLSE